MGKRMLAASVWLLQCSSGADQQRSGQAESDLTKQGHSWLMEFAWPVLHGAPVLHILCCTPPCCPLGV